MLSAIPEWQQLALYALAAAFILTLLFRLPYVGQVLSAAVSFCVLALCLFLLLQQGPYRPWLAPWLEQIGLGGQEVVGDELRISMAPDGHFWVRARINGVDTRMLVDSGATVTALSTRTAGLANVKLEDGPAPMFARTAAGVVRARTAKADEFTVGTIEAPGLKVAVSPALNGVDVLGMNFLSRLAGWRVEGPTMILTPHPEG
jgi:aspartyl protease family protein